VQLFQTLKPVSHGGGGVLNTAIDGFLVIGAKKFDL
jgi:hypothetical protein